MTEDALHHSLTPLSVGIVQAATNFVHMLDRPGMTIAELRASPAAITFRNQLLAFRKWMRVAIENDTKQNLPPEVKAFLVDWFGEDERAVAQRESGGIGIQTINTDRKDAESAKVGGE